MQVNQKDGKVIVGEPTPDLGENRYLTHFTSEIFYEEQVVGYILFTRYHYKKVQDDHIPMRWLVQPHSYMSMVQDLVIGSESRHVTLPLDIGESISNDFGHVYILDEVTCDSVGIKKKAYKEAISITLKYLEDKTDGVLISDGAGLARYLSKMKEAPDTFWSFFNTYRVSGKFLYTNSMNSEYQYSENISDPF